MKEYDFNEWNLKLYTNVEVNAVFHWFNILTSGGHWYLEVLCHQDHLWSERELGLKSEHQKNVWFDTSHHVSSLVSSFTLQRQTNFGSSEVIKGSQSLRMESEHQKMYDLILNMTHFHWYIIYNSA